MLHTVASKKMQAQQLQQRILEIIHPTTKHKLSKPQGIAKAFSDYYQSLCDLQNDANTIQPSDSVITSFFQSCNLPRWSHDQFLTISQPFIPQEVEFIIKSLPNSNSESTCTTYSAKGYAIITAQHNTIRSGILYAQV